MQPQTRSTFRQRFGYYAFGLAIGFVMLGLLWNGKDVATAPPPGVVVPERVTPAWAKPREGQATPPAADQPAPGPATQSPAGQ
ncbi:MAG: hypothetical protein WC718_01705 [Phycisphaerales bacterium]|jgi:hypothetical protein